MITSFKILAVTVMDAELSYIPIQYNAKMLLGKWKVINVRADYPKTMTGTDKMKAEMDFGKFAERFKSSPFIFAKDSVLSVMGKQGQWALEKDGIHIRFIMMKNEELKATITLLNASELQFSVIDHDSKEYFTLTKVK